jgi:hypothetical protein|tara:strand:- start:748 stop:1227 length:480 start_codon:yes stop_codon:yes gene_type:complete
MKKLLLVLAFSLLALNVANAETILLKCEYIEGKKDVYLVDTIVKTVKPTHLETVYEIKLNPALKKIVDAPFYGVPHTKMEQWQDDYILWLSEVNVVLKYDSLYIFNLDRVTGILTKDFKSYERVVEDGHYQKDSNGNWVRDLQYHITSTYQCKKEDRLF